jgi:hypothetical protein
MAVSVGPRSMWRVRGARWTVAAVVVAGGTALLVYQGIARSSPSSTAVGGEHALVRPVGGTSVARVTLSANAIKRLDLQTVPARIARVQGKRRVVVPYGAVLYDASGRTWVYASATPRTFLRHRVAVDSIDGDRAVLASGASAGMRVVTVGVQELWGAELGIDNAEEE